MLELNGLSRWFGGNPVISALDLRVEQGEILGILGPNGAGKSTLFNLVAGALPPTAGTILFSGKDVTRTKLWDRCRLGIGRTYQIPRPFTHMSVFENVLVGAVHGAGLRQDKARKAAWQALDQCGLADKATRPAGNLSLLDLKRLELAKAVAVQPRLLLLDEIAGGLTDGECDLLLAILHDLHRGGATVIWIEHVIHVLRRFASRLAVLYGGTILVSGPPQTVLDDPQVKSIYLGD